MNFQLPTLSNEYYFEDFVCDLFNFLYKTTSFQKYRTKGSSQYGIDIFSAEKLVAIQCKKKDNTRSEKTLIKELIKDFNESLNLVKKFPHEYNTFILATTTKKYSKVQDYAMLLSQNNRLDIQFFDWNTISEKLQSNHELMIKYNYLPKNFINIDENEDKHNWEGTYKYINNTPFDPFFQTRIFIYEYPDKFTAEFEVDGWQTCIRINCNVKISNSRLDLFFKEYQENDMFKSLFSKNKHVLSLKYEKDKFITVWKTYKPYFSKNDEEIAYYKDKNDFTFLKKYAGEYGFEVEKYLENRLRKLCGKNYKDLTLNISTRGPFQLEDYHLIINGCHPHMCGIEEGIIVLNFLNNELHVAILHDSEKILVFSENENFLPKKLIEHINKWKELKDIYNEYDFMKEAKEFLKRILNKI